MGDLIAKAVGRPVQLTWSRWQEQLMLRPRAPLAAVLSARTGQQGYIDTFRARVATPPTAQEFGRRLLNRDKVDVQIGGITSASREALRPIVDRTSVPYFYTNQYEGGGFSVSNLGMYGIKNFTSIINPPQSCIIAVGAGEERAIVVNGKVEVATMMTVTMSCDHRVVDGATGAKFLQTFKQFIEEPASMLL